MTPARAHVMISQSKARILTVLFVVLHTVHRASDRLVRRCHRQHRPKRECTVFRSAVNCSERAAD